ncbi:hypothetical protein SASPL_148525 [Salvia splendens]|uniref:BED-type domain-containing protein n=1 Tax=Salvia splendens TaxID=180675 RepID=A0A8X8W989_SALSN|nr:hypothetical protein SASPL_148525 [Salvia splendens]
MPCKNYVRFGRTSEEGNVQCDLINETWSATIMESAASHSHPLPLTSEPSKQQSASTNDEGTSRKLSAAEDSSEKPPLAPTKRGKSQYWKHFEKTMKKTSQGERKIGICNYCKSEIPTVTGSTTRLKYHLEKKCELSPFYAASGNDKGQTVLTNETMGKGNEVSFRAVEGKGFVALVHELEPRKVFERMADEWIPFMRYFDEKDDKGKQRMGPPLKEDWDNAKRMILAYTRIRPMMTLLFIKKLKKLKKAQVTQPLLKRLEMVLQIYLLLVNPPNDELIHQMMRLIFLDDFDKMKGLVFKNQDQDNY